MILDRDRMIAEYHAMERQQIALMNVAMDRCRNQLERDQCWRAYHDEMDHLRDEIVQRQGGPARAFYMPARKVR